jgi:hypothetical protein
MTKYIGIRATAAAFVSALFFYVMPTLGEMAVEDSFGPVVVYAFGDAIGCALIAAACWEVGLCLYLGLALFKVLLLQSGAVELSTLHWISDAVPAAVLSVVAASFASASHLRKETK